jgi:hypothetical protein
MQEAVTDLLAALRSPEEEVLSDALLMPDRTSGRRRRSGRIGNSLLAVSALPTRVVGGEGVCKNLPR